MNHPLLESDRFPYLRLEVVIGTEVLLVDALLDTGFDGGVVLPPSLIPRDVAPEGYITWNLADGSEVDAPGYFGMVRVGVSDPVEVTITGLGADVLAGRELLAYFRVILDHGQRLIVEL